MKFYTTKEVAEIVHYKPKTITMFIRQGRLKAYKIGKSYQISEEQLKEFIESGK